MADRDPGSRARLGAGGVVGVAAAALAGFLVGRRKSAAGTSARSSTKQAGPIPPGSYTPATLPRLSPDAQSILDAVKAAAPASSTLKSAEAPGGLQPSDQPLRQISVEDKPLRRIRID
jgi:hypothetical protein